MSNMSDDAAHWQSWECHNCRMLIREDTPPEHYYTRPEDDEESSGCSSASGLDVGLALLPALGLSLLSISVARFPSSGLASLPDGVTSLSSQWFIDWDSTWWMSMVALLDLRIRMAIHI